MIRAVTVAACWLLLTASAFAQTITPGVTTRYPAGCTYGSTCHVEVIAGDPEGVVILVPHGGYLKPATMTTRTAALCPANHFNLGQDTFLEEQGRNLSYFWRPWIVIFLVSREKVDGNREVGCGAGTDPDNIAAWNLYHSTIATVIAQATAQTERALVIDLHGHGLPEQRCQIDVGLTNAEQQQDDELIDALAGESTIQAFAALVTDPFHTLLRDYGTRMTSHSRLPSGLPRFPCIPSRMDHGTEPGESWIGTSYSVVTYGCATVDAAVCALQLELPLPWRDTNPERGLVSEAMRDVTRDVVREWGVVP